MWLDPCKRQQRICHSIDFFPECATWPTWMKNSPTSRIIGGQFAKSAIPWQARLDFNNKFNISSSCGATIIDEETVLTTADCVIMSVSPELLDKAFLEIEAGIVFHGHSTAQTRGISQIIVHPCNERATGTIDRYVIINSILIHTSCKEMFSKNFDHKAMTHLIFFVGRL